MSVCLKDVSFCEGGSITLDAGSAYQSYLWNGQEGESTLDVNVSGIYIVEASTDSGQTSSDTITVTVYPNPIIDLGADLVVQADTFIYIAAEPGYSSYEWCGNNTCRILYVSTQYMSRPSDIWVNVTDENGCIGTDTMQLILEAPLAENTAKLTQTDVVFIVQNPVIQDEEIIETTSYNIYPNPTNGKFFISVSDPDRVKQIDLFDLHGSLIKSFKDIKQFPLEIDLSSQSYGIYLIRIREQNSLKQFKVIYQN